jgi:hypothetical protein
MCDLPHLTTLSATIPVTGIASLFLQFKAKTYCNFRNIWMVVAVVVFMGDIIPPPPSLDTFRSDHGIFAVCRLLKYYVANLGIPWRWQWFLYNVSEEGSLSQLPSCYYRLWRIPLVVKTPRIIFMIYIYIYIYIYIHNLRLLPIVHSLCL